VGTGTGVALTTAGADNMMLWPIGLAIAPLAAKTTPSARIGKIGFMIDLLGHR
jgi:hypothetical protein